MVRIAKSEIAEAKSDTNNIDFGPVEKIDFDPAYFDRFIDQEFKEVHGDVMAPVAVTCRGSQNEGLSRSKVMREIFSTARIVAGSDSTALLLGESGSGKGFLAQYIHDHSSRASHPYRHLNCAGLSKDIAWSAMFGHEKGAFTGATRQKPGEFELAMHGTVFLDEIGDMDLEVQNQLFTFLDTHSFQRLGGDKPIQSNARIVTATNLDLRKAIKEKRFREELYYRLAVVLIEVPPLRKRVEDIPSLTKKLLSDYSGSNSFKISRTALHKLCSYRWPGNVRELRNVLERASVFCSDGIIHPEHIHFNQGTSNHGMENSKRTRRPSDKVLREISELLRTGHTMTEQADKHRVSRPALHKWLVEAGLYVPEKIPTKIYKIIRVTNKRSPPKFRVSSRTSSRERHDKFRIVMTPSTTMFSH